ncbi:NAD(P)-binding domain-containing protein [Streptomyces iconiensis]|uniref:NAD(P)-binding domain-containing protein n=1 Tax=Streptomyces iconiensis TaxID=1384038 RepID=A0ABT6ZYM6_9ACTN|nr:NAD(P)-binding domain-containing protein [Streptomyces iconiensis]MDJ1133736.1 NAD(P)-binding domain-containing protein [Streptomyces iconiensis]
MRTTGHAPVVVIGAGPYGLSTAAHLHARGVHTRVFGEPMVSWRDHMPEGMLLKSTPVASNIDAPQPGHTLVDYCESAGERRYESDWDLVPVETFARYGEWFQRRLVPGLERVRVASVEPRGGGFEVKLDSGELCAARAVVVASGLTGFAHVPRALAAAAPDGLSPTGPVSHSSQHTDMKQFADRDLVVVGAGQSALETAVLAAEAGAASVRVVARGRMAVGFGDPPDHQPRLRPESPFGRAWSLYGLTYYAGTFRHLPAPVRHGLVRRVLGPLGAWWLRERFTGRVGVTQGRRIVRTRAARYGGALLELAGGVPIEADHIIAATGYRPDISSLGFLGPGIRAALARSGPAPLLGPGFRSSVPHLYFTGLPAAASYGPVMRFVVGTGYASRRLAEAITL